MLLSTSQLYVDREPFPQKGCAFTTDHGYEELLPKRIVNDARYMLKVSFGCRP